MPFKTYTCCICGKEGLTKPQSYAIEGKGRACREHQEAQDAEANRAEIRMNQIQKQQEKKSSHDHIFQKVAYMKRMIECKGKTTFEFSEEWDAVMTLQKINSFCIQYLKDPKNVCFQSLFQNVMKNFDHITGWTKLVYKSLLDSITRNILVYEDKVRCLDICGNTDMQLVIEDIEKLTYNTLHVFYFTNPVDIRRTCQSFTEKVFTDMLNSVNILKHVNTDEHWKEKLAKMFVDIADSMKRTEELILYYKKRGVLIPAVTEEYFDLWIEFSIPYRTLLTFIYSGSFEGNMMDRLLDAVTEAKEAILKMRELSKERS